jgi:apolipoprotein D and lipocalin family protein
MKVKALVIGSLTVLVPLVIWGTRTRASRPPLEVVPQVDLTRYMGTWYEIARFPHRFEKGCVAAKATYTMRENGTVDVLNECRLDRFDGPVKTARGIARVFDEKTKAKLKVSFFWPFYGEYWIIDLGDDYEYAVVGHPGRKYLWILSRKPAMDEALYGRLIETIASKGYDPSRLVKTPQPEGL